MSLESNGQSGGTVRKQAEGLRKGPVDLTTTKVVADTFFSAGARVFVSLLKPVRTFVFGRYLGPHLYGILNIPTPFIQICTLTSNIGFTDSLTKLIPGYLQEGSPEKARMIFRSAAFLTAVLSIFWYTLLLIFSGTIVTDVARQPDAILPFRLYTLIIPFLALNTFFAAALITFQRGKLRAKITIFYGLLNILLPIIAVMWKRNVSLAIVGFVISEVLGSIVFSVAFCRYILPTLGKHAGPLLRGIKQIFSLGITFFFAQLGWSLINSVDRIMIKMYLPAAELGYYSLSVYFITALNFFPSGIGITLVPSLTVARTTGDDALYRRQIRNVSRLSFALLVPSILMLFTVSRDLIMLVVPKFEQSILVLKILLFIGIFDIACKIGKASLVAHGKGAMLSAAYLFVVAWNIVWNRILIPEYGIAGAAYTSLSSYFLLAVILQMLMKSTSGTSVKPIHLFHPLVLSLVYPAIGFILPLQGHFIRIIIVFLAGSVLYGFLGLVTKLARREDLCDMKEALSPRTGTGHVRIAVRVISLLESLSKRLQ